MLMKSLVQQPGDLRVLEALVGHHVAPMAGRIADGQEDRLLLGRGPRPSLGAPGIPVDRIVGVLQQIGADFVRQSIGHGGSRIPKNVPRAGQERPKLHNCTGDLFRRRAAVARQFDAVRAEVLKYKDHPALLIWAIGNELNMSAHNPRVWDAVNDLSKMIHQLDTNHLTTTPLAGVNRDVVREIKARAPDLDLLSFQVYGDLMNLPQRLREADWDGPYLVTEWGATGHWEVNKTDWGAPIEDDSTLKADLYLKRFEAGIASDHTQCVGSYVFLWGQKQERTPTWFGLFLKSGEETAAVDTMHYLWKGAWPAERSPRLDGAWLDGKTSRQSIHLKSSQAYSARVWRSPVRPRSVIHGKCSGKAPT